MRSTSWAFHLSSRSATNRPISPANAEPLPTGVPFRSGNHAKLLQHAQLVEVVPLFLDLAAGDADDGDARDRHLFAGRGDAHEIAPVGPAVRPAIGYLVPFGDQVLDGGTPIGEGAAVHADELLDALR